MKFPVALFGLFHICCGSKVYDWQRDWGPGLVSMEMAQVQDGDRQILHSSLGTGVDINIAAISMHDFMFTSKKFKKGVIAIRPILSPGTQVCFVAKETKNWNSATATAERRHKATLAKDEVVTYVLQKSLPGKLDPLAVQSVANFCDVDRNRIFYMKPVDDLSSVSTKVKMQGLFSRYYVGIPDRYVEVVVDAVQWNLSNATIK